MPMKRKNAARRIKRRHIRKSDLPRFPDHIDKLWHDGEPALVDDNGVQKCWVGIGWVTHGSADGSEPIVLVDD